MKQNRIVNILGTEYTIYQRTQDEDERLKNCDGYCDKTTKEIVVLTINKDNCELGNPDAYARKVLRHECVHAFFFESGLHEYSNWISERETHSEQIVDWIAIQFPKIAKIYKELGIAD